MSEWVERARSFWQGLQPREQLLVGLAGGALAVTILLVGLVMPLQAARSAAADDAEASERALQTMVRMKREWDGLHGRLDEVESRIQQTRSQPNLLTLLDGLATQAGVKPTSMEPRQSGKSDAYQETKVEVSLKNVTLRQAVSYLSSIERAEQPLSVKSLRVKRRPGRAQGDQPAADLIDVTFSVSTFKPLS